MDAEVEPVNPAEAEWVARQRRWTQGSLRFVLPSLFLVYLLYVAQAVGKYNDGTAALWGYLILLAFAACYLAFVRGGPEASGKRFWTLYGISAALFVAEVPFAREAAFVMCLYITAITVSRLGGRSAPIVVALALAALLVPLAIPSWHDNLSDTWGTVTPVAIPIVAVVTLAVKRVFEGNLALAEARTELARLAAENERFRIARDLHDLLGHSLTTITVKAGLARRLGEADPARSQQEIAEVEDLARRSLADVRAAVANYRDVTLAGELATGRELLRAAGIDADLPRAVDVVDPVEPGAVRLGRARGAHERRPPCPRQLVLGAAVAELRRDRRRRRRRRRRRERERRIGERPGGTARTGGRGRRCRRRRAGPAAGVAVAGLADARGRRMTIRLLLADDQELIRSAFAALLELHDDFEVVAAVGRGDEVVAAAKAHRPDVALLDIEMPGIDGLAAAGVLTQEVPECRSLILTTFGRPGYLRRAMESGACGFVVKDSPPEQLADAIRRVAAGERVVDPVLAADTLAQRRLAADRSRARCADRRPPRSDRRRDRREAVPVRGHGPQLPVRRDRQDRHAQSSRGRKDRGRAWLALTAPRRRHGRQNG